ncbi:MAG TPA: zinc ribbon domain-containing protein, partial [Candidatus Binataceae bacterium]
MLLPPPAYGVVVTGATGDPMRCPSCKHDNSVDASFCDACGAKLESVCATCGSTNQPGARFC